MARRKKSEPVIEIDGEEDDEESDVVDPEVEEICEKGTCVFSHELENGDNWIMGYNGKFVAVSEIGNEGPFDDIESAITGSSYAAQIDTSTTAISCKLLTARKLIPLLSTPWTIYGPIQFKINGRWHGLSNDATTFVRIPRPIRPRDDEDDYD